MLKFLIGPVLLGVGYIAGSYYGSDAEQLVRKSPSVTYAAVEKAIANVRQSGTTFFEGGKPVPYEIHIDRTLDQKLVLALFFDGKQGAEADIDFLPRDNGASTCSQPTSTPTEASSEPRSPEPARRGSLMLPTGC